MCWACLQTSDLPPMFSVPQSNCYLATSWLGQVRNWISFSKNPSFKHGLYNTSVSHQTKAPCIKTPSPVMRAWLCDLRSPPIALFLHLKFHNDNRHPIHRANHVIITDFFKSNRTQPNLILHKSIVSISNCTTTTTTATNFMELYDVLSTHVSTKNFPYLVCSFVSNCLYLGSSASDLRHCTKLIAWWVGLGEF